MTRDLGEALAGLEARGWDAGRRDLEGEGAPDVLARYVGRHLLGALRSVPGEGAEQVAAQIGLANQLLDFLKESTAYPVIEGDAVDEPGRLLLHLVKPSGDLGANQPPARPVIPLRSSVLLVNGHRDQGIGRAVASELASARRVDLLCAFVRWTGFLVIRDALAEFLRSGRELRVLTTVYTGATQRRALDELCRLGAQIKVSYETDQTRLHAKAWLFHRAEGLSTAYIGSSNLSRAALVDGLEWNVRASETDNSGIVARFRAVFDQYWAEAEFQPYDPAGDGDRLARALRRQTGEGRTAAIDLRIEVAPKAHQQEILERLDAERQRGHWKNLVVAATGTGKTWVAAFDYARLRRERGEASLLFVAHREEILAQSRLVFQVVLGDNSFGELLVGGARPEAGRHVFASIQSLRAERLAGLRPDAYDVVIVDEFHHAAAPSYDALLRTLSPRVLLGLTATPERTDGQDVLQWFDGRVAADLRLWKALDQGLLCPFHYFGVHDGTDLSGIGWTRGRYDLGELERLYTGHHGRAARILQEVKARVADPSRMRALGFCAGVDHAVFMARRFTEAGVGAVAIHGGTPDDERRKALRDLRDGRVQVVFSVDLFNEGVDLPEVDTVLFLRPTESATVFLQQLGRGLRWAPGKGSLLVLDFIGNAHRKFRFDLKYRAILGGTRRDFSKQVEVEFPFLPPGCSLQLDRLAREVVLANVKDALRLGRAALMEDLRSLGDVGLATFLAQTGVELEDVYSRPAATNSWAALRRAAGLPEAVAGPNEEGLAKAFGRLLHLDDPLRLGTWQEWVSGHQPPELMPLETLEGRLQLMLFAALGNRKRPVTDLGAALAELWGEPAMRTEFLQLLTVLADRSRSAVYSLDFGKPVPLQVHGTYALYEILAAFRTLAKGRLRETREGVLYDEATRSALLFVTLEKSEKEYSATTRYDDYPISPTEFHWESQSVTRAVSPTGRRYVNHEREGGHVLLFVRQRKKDGRGETMPYRFLGPVSYVRHEGERPMRIVWRLRHAMPAELFQEAKVVAG
ncbi:MAG: DUF3427 domain-containing protein [Deferrisomatales bacterium]|nr:DUF3427 domain-containing protein [Deferrisomatales bacterium]